MRPTVINNNASQRTSAHHSKTRSLSRKRNNASQNGTSGRATAIPFLEDMKTKSEEDPTKNFPPRNPERVLFKTVTKTEEVFKNIYDSDGESHNMSQITNATTNLQPTKVQFEHVNIDKYSY
jgi:hypothetical protein